MLSQIWFYSKRENILNVWGCWEPQKNNDLPLRAFPVYVAAALTDD